MRTSTPASLCSSFSAFGGGSWWRLVTNAAFPVSSGAQAELQLSAAPSPGHHRHLTNVGPGTVEHIPAIDVTTVVRVSTSS
jgi:hypothetical protein